jgi:hypothetical protein
MMTQQSETVVKVDKPTTFAELVTKHDLRPYCWSEVGNGWIPMLDELVTKLVASGWEVSSIAQIKEKFGGLRFYVDDATPEQYAMIETAEALSYKTCESCGKPGKVRNNKDWICTLCEECNKPV